MAILWTSGLLAGAVTVLVLSDILLSAVASAQDAVELPGVVGNAVICACSLMACSLLGPIGRGKLLATVSTVTGSYAELRSLR